MSPCPSPRSLVLGLVSLTSMAFISTAKAQDITVYGTRNTPNELYEINLNTGVATLATVPPISFSMVACARHPFTGEVWLLGNAGNNIIATWDPVTNTETIITPGTGVQHHRFGFNACGQLFGVPLNTKGLYEIDTATGESNFVGSINGVGTEGATGDLAFAPGSTGEFYYLIADDLYVVDLASLNATLIGSVPFDSSGLAFTADGTLYGCSKTELWEIDPETANATFIGGFGFGNINDLSGALPSHYFEASPSSVATNENLNLFSKQGGSNAPMALFLTGVDGTPFFTYLLQDTYDSNQEWSLDLIVGAGLSGFSVDLAVLGIDADGKLFLTNSDSVIFE